MFALCIESSHKKGMGHFFRMMNFIEFLSTQREAFVVLINEDAVSNGILRDRGLPFCTVDLCDEVSNWETDVIRRFGIDIWLNDRLETGAIHAGNVRANDVSLVTFDDLGGGAELSHAHFAAMPCIFLNNPKGEKVFAGVEYMILNKGIDECRRLRNRHDRILVTLGGSDTHGATVKIAWMLSELSKPADIIIGPSFMHKRELFDTADERFSIMDPVPSLVKVFVDYDLAITGGGITPFEANASGLPCIIIASEPHEIENAEFLCGLGSSVFAGAHDCIDESLFAADLDIRKMSENGLERVKTSGVREIYGIIRGVV